MATALVSSLRHAWRVEDLRNRILFTLGMIFVYRVGVHIPIPGLDPRVIESLMQQGSIFGLLDIFSGGALRYFSVFAMGIIPYINASIIMQLLQVVIPKIEQWAKEGEEGRKKITQWTRYGTVLLAFIQAAGLTFFIVRSRPDALLFHNVLGYLTVVIILTAGTTFLMWLGEQMTEKGIGNGISILIFAGIVSRLPSGFVTMIQYLKGGVVHYFNVIILALVGLAIIVGVIVIQQGQRRIPVQYAKRMVGRRMYGGRSTHIPIRVNTAGVIPVIFASSLLALPQTIAQFFSHPWIQAVNNFFRYGGFWHESIFFLLIVAFTFFYTAIVFNPADVAENIRKYGGFIPGIRPGRPTKEYLERVLIRLTVVGGLFLATVSVLPPIVSAISGVPNIYFGGTALLIVVGVALETMMQIESQLVMRQYQGFLR
ncbi:MAG: preprotein translocase subunit SecY [Bacillota bacterium]|nr:preprotein translocase subunit SecY [Bacillota bacterium]